MTELEAQAKDYAMSRKLNLSEPTDITHVIELIEKAYIAGSKGQWHDLRKNPADLPDEPNEKMSVNETWAYVKFFDNTYGLVDKGALNNYSGAIAWCELPTFDKE